MAKGMHMANKNLKLIPICSLDYMANIAKNNANGEFWCVLNALSGNLFACKYTQDGKRINEPKMLLPDEIQTLEGDIVGLAGESIELCARNVEFSSQNLLKYATKLYNENAFSNECDFLPIYLRKSQAEVMLDGN